MALPACVREEKEEEEEGNQMASGEERGEGIQDLDETRYGSKAREDSDLEEKVDGIGGTEQADVGLLPCMVVSRRRSGRLHGCCTRGGSSWPGG